MVVAKCLPLFVRMFALHSLGLALHYMQRRQNLISWVNWSLYVRNSLLSYGHAATAIHPKIHSLSLEKYYSQSQMSSKEKDSQKSTMILLTLVG